MLFKVRDSPQGQITHVCYGKRLIRAITFRVVLRHCCPGLFGVSLETPKLVGRETVEEKHLFRMKFSIMEVVSTPDDPGLPIPNSHIHTLSEV